MIAIGLAVILALIAGWRLSRRADRSAPLAARSIGPAPTACAHCGRTLPHDAVFCAQCGRPVGATQTITKCGHCGRALRPGVLDSLGLAAAIEWQGADFHERTGIRCDVKIDVTEGAFSAYAGLKTAKVSEVVQLGSQDVEELTVQEMNYGVLGGFGIDFVQAARDHGLAQNPKIPGIRLDAGVGAALRAWRNRMSRPGT